MLKSLPQTDCSSSRPPKRCPTLHRRFRNVHRCRCATAIRTFDRNFGPEFLESLPGYPGVYLVYDQKGELIYVGKAKNLKRRLSQYRNTLRLKKHRRMRGIVKEAARIEIQCAQTHLDACLTETRLIQGHRPRWNIVGAYSFLYPLIGIQIGRAS